MSKTIFIFLVVFSFFVFLNSSYSFEITYPLKTDLVDEAMQEGQIAVKNYRSLLDQGKILQFYQNSLDREGWQEVDSLSLDRAKSIPEVRIYGFARGEEALILEFSPFAVEGLVFYTIRMGEVSKIFASQGKVIRNLESGQDIESLEGIPIYPNARKGYYQKEDSGFIASHRTSDNADQVKEFYLKRMSELKWGLINQEAMTKEFFYDLSKMDMAQRKMVEDVDVDGTTLEFKKGNKRCFIFISKLTPAGISSLKAEYSALLAFDKTIIAIDYEEKK